MREERDNAKKLLAQIEWSQIPSLKAENAATQNAADICKRSKELELAEAIEQEKEE